MQEIASFGWASNSNTGNPNPVTRTTLSAEQGADMKALVLARFQNAEVRNRTAPFANKPERFLGRIDFKDNWILLKIR